MDRTIASKWFFWVVIGLAVVYLWVHFEGTLNFTLLH